MENARPVIPAGKISLNNNQDTVEEETGLILLFIIWLVFVGDITRALIG